MTRENQTLASRRDLLIGRGWSCHHLGPLGPAAAAEPSAASAGPQGMNIQRTDTAVVFIDRRTMC
jgi:hypothetical protein